MFLRFKNQFKISNGVIYALDYTPILIVAKELDFVIDDLFMQKLNIFESTIIEIINSNGETVCTEKDKEKCKVQYGNHFEWACKRCEKNPKNRVNKNGKKS